METNDDTGRVFTLYLIDFDGRSDQTRLVGTRPSLDGAMQLARRDAASLGWYVSDDEVREIGSAEAWQPDELGGFSYDEPPFVLRPDGRDWTYAIFPGRVARGEGGR